MRRAFALAAVAALACGSAAAAETWTKFFTMENGAVTETGTHETLMASGGRYSQLWRTQMYGSET